MSMFTWMLIGAFLGAIAIMFVNSFSNKGCLIIITIIVVVILISTIAMGIALI